MDVDIFSHRSDELGREVSVAVDRSASNEYVNQFRHNFPFPSILRFLLGDRTGIKTFVDIGANIGAVALPAAMLGIKTIAIEAMPDNFVLLCEGARANGLTNMRPLHVAASDRAGLVAMASHSAYAHVSESGGTLVPALPIDDLMTMHGVVPDLIKLDVEGHEPHVLKGMKRTLRKCRPMLVSEVNVWSLRSLAVAMQYLRDLEELDYDLYLFMADGTVSKRPAADVPSTLVTDYLAVPLGWDRPMPTVRTLGIEEELTMMEAEPVSDPHPILALRMTVLAHRVFQLEALGAEGPRVDALKLRIRSDPQVAEFIDANWCL